MFHKFTDSQHSEEWKKTLKEHEEKKDRVIEKYKDKCGEKKVERTFILSKSFLPSLRDHHKLKNVRYEHSWHSWPGGRFPYQMDGGARWKFRTEPLRGTKILFCGRRLKMFSPPRGSNSKTTHYPLSYLLAQYPKRYNKSFPCGPGTKTAFLTAKRYDEHSHPFYMRIFPPPFPPG